LGPLASLLRANLEAAAALHLVLESLAVLAFATEVDVPTERWLVNGEVSDSVLLSPARRA